MGLPSVQAGRSPHCLAVRYRDRMSSVEWVALFILLPLAIFAVIALLVMTPSWMRGPKYRPGVSWWAEPVWLGGIGLDAARDATPAAEGGGCSARW